MLAKSEARPGKQQPALAPRMAEPVASGHVVAHECEGPLGHRDPVRLPERQPGMDQRRDHQAVPVRQNLVVQARPDPLFPDFVQHGPQHGECSIDFHAAR